MRAQHFCNAHLTICKTAIWHTGTLNQFYSKRLSHRDQENKTGKVIAN